MGVHAGVSARLATGSARSTATHATVTDRRIGGEVTRVRRPLRTVCARVVSDTPAMRVPAAASPCSAVTSSALTISPGASAGCPAGRAR